MSDITIDYKIQTADSAKSVAELRRAMKDLLVAQQEVNTSTAAGKAEFSKLQEAINRTEGKAGDLTDSFSTLRGSGIERVNGSLALLKQGFLNADPEQLTIGMQGLKAAMSAVPILLLVEGAKLLFDNFGSIIKVFDSSAQEIERNNKALTDLNFTIAANKVGTDQLIITKEAELKQLERQGAGLKAILKITEEINGIKQDQFRDQLSSTDKEIGNLVAQINDLKTGLNWTDFLPSMFGGDATDKKIQELEDKIKAASLRRGEITTKQAQEEVTENEDTLSKIDAANQKAYEKALARVAKEFELWKKKRDFAAGGSDDIKNIIEKEAKDEEKVSDDRFLASIERGKREFTIEQDEFKKTHDGRLEALERAKDAELALVSEGSQAAFIIEKKYADAAVQIKIQQYAQYAQYAQAGMSAISGINDIVNASEDQKLKNQSYATNAQIQNLDNRSKDAIDIETARTNKLLNNDNLTSQQREQISYDSETRKRNIEINAANESLKVQQQADAAALVVRKRQFDINKKIQLAGSIVSGASAAIKTFGELGFTPAGFTAVAIGAAATLVQIAKIASAQFDDGGAAAKATVIPPASIDTRGGAISSSPSGASPSPTQFNPQAINSDNTNINGQRVGGGVVGVYEGDIRKALTRVDVYETRAAFGRTK